VLWWVVLVLVGCYCSLFWGFSSILGVQVFVGSVGFLRVSFGCSCVYFLCTYGRLTLSLIKSYYLSKKRF
jgi:hypothetical protein